MSTFTLAISCFTISNLPWFMDLTFQVPMQYCSLQHQILLLSPVTSTTGYCFCFGSIPSFFLDLFLHWSPVAYLAPDDLGSSSFGILSFCLFLLFMGFSRQEYWSGLPFPSPVDHRNQKSNCQHLLHHRKRKRVPEKHLFLLYWLCQILWLCGSQYTVENSSRNGNTRSPYLPLEKAVCRSGSNS